MQQEGEEHEDGQRDNEVDGEIAIEGDDEEQGESGRGKKEEESELDLRHHLRDDILETVRKAPKKTNVQ